MFGIGDLWLQLTKQIGRSKLAGLTRSSFMWSKNIKINEVLRTNFRYADVMCSLLNNQFGYLIASIEREVDPPGCMPHSLSFDDVKGLFGKF